MAWGSKKEERREAVESGGQLSARQARIAASEKGGGRNLPINKRGTKKSGKGRD
ncbi:hypothetical protein EV647_0599 [Kribbella sp. VKM Ac-2566]|nr:hypothetical protein EV647_0599 [Kribbella sp. VKM Ac-2566]